MKKKYMKFFIKTVFVCVISILALIPHKVNAEIGQLSRVGESNRYATAAKSATTNWTNADNVVLVCGETFPDAVSASTLAKQLDAPILLTTSTSLNLDTKLAIDTLKPKNIYIVGGTGAVSQNIRDELKNSSYNIIELYGKDRYETNVAVANELIKLGISPNDVMLVSGTGFSDALSVAPIAATNKQILLLGSNDNDSMKPIINFIKSNNSKTTVIGTKYSINDDMYSNVAAVKRVNGGADRFGTNLNVLNEYKDILKNDKLFIATAVGNSFPDALVASSLAGKWSAPLVLLDNETSEATSSAIKYIKDKISNSTCINVMGGNGVISDEVISRINGTISSTNEDTLINTNGLNSIKVTFNREVNKDTAEIAENYQINGNDLEEATASAVLQDDKKTVIITLANPYPQYKEVVFTVKNAILDEALQNTIPKIEKKITFVDTNMPTIQSLTVNGNNKLTLQFSEPIRIKMEDLSSIKINNQSIVNFGLNTSISGLYEKSGVWAGRAELYFDTPLPAGQNILKIQTGISGLQFDNAAGFPIKETSLNFNIDSVVDRPKVVKVQGDSSGSVYITYNRAMDTQTALMGSNYKINGNTVLSSYIDFDEGSNDTIVKIKGVNSLINNGGNVVSISNNIKDAYGNKIDDNTNVSFNVTSDTTKPQVISVNMIDSVTMRIKFNKNVSNIYATNKANYKLVDSNGIVITYKISEIKTTNKVPGDNTNTYDIKFTKDNALTDSKYTLTIENIIDTNACPNVMDDYTVVINGIDDIAPVVTAIVQKADDEQSVVIFFSEPMDSQTITNASNYYFVDGNGESKPLPKEAVIGADENNTSVTIKFPFNYILKQGNNSNYVLKIGIANVKDKASNVLAGIVYFDSISTDYTNGPSIINNTAKLSYDGDDVKAQVTLNVPLENLNISDFKVANVTPDSGVISGKNVILIFKDGIQNNEKINAIKEAGVNAELTISNPKSTDASGRILKQGSQKVYDMQLYPKTNSGLWTAKSDLGNNSVVISFDENIDGSIAGLYDDDFLITNERTGEKLNAASIIVEGKNVVYKFKDGSINSGDRINIRASSLTQDINIRSEKSMDENWSVYKPSNYDLKIRTIIAD